MPTTLAGNPIIVDTRIREYEDFRTNALELAGSLTPEWTDFYQSDPGVILVELFSGMADILSYYIDRAVNESHWSTAQLKQSMIDMASLINYEFSPSVCATVDIDVTVSGAGTLNGVSDLFTGLPLKVGNIATREQKQFTFELLTTEVVPGAGTYTLTFIEGSSIFEEALGASDGVTPGLSFVLKSSPVAADLLGTPVITINIDGDQWEMVSDFTESEPTDKHFRVQINSFGVARVYFGDGVNGAIPGVFNIYASYRVGGGGEANNIGIGKIDSILAAASVATAVTNSAKPSGGDEAETVEHARENAPKTYATQDRAVTHEDYEALARSINGVFKAKAGLLNGATEEAVYIAVTGDNPVPSGTWDDVKQTGTGLLGIVGALLVEKSCTATRIMMRPITALDVELEVEVIALDKAYASKVKIEVIAAANRVIRSTRAVTIPNTIPLSALMAELEAVNGVDYVNVKKFYRKPYIEPLNVGLGDPSFSVVEVTNGIEDEIWTLYFTSSTTFSVEGTVSGTQVLTGVIGTEYTSDMGELTFTISAGSISNKVGDQYRILTGALVGNITVQPKEIPVYTDTSGVSIIGGIK